MKKYILLVLVCMIFRLYSIGQSNHKVLVIGIDGCRADALIAANTPTIDSLLHNAIYSLHSQNDDITISGPGWSAMLTGVWSNKHGVTNNSFSGSNYGQYPHFFSRIEAHNPSLRTISIAQWHPINNNIVLTHADVKVNVANEASLTLEAVNRLTNDDPDVLFLHFDDVDHAGHSFGFSPTNTTYLREIEQVDEQITIILNAMRSRPNFANENWLILLAPDHGGTGTSHGGTTIQEETIFTIAHNKNFTPLQIRPDTLIQPDLNCLPLVKYLSLTNTNDNVNIPNIPSYNFGANQDFTIECRVNTSSAGDVAIIGNKNWDSGVNKGFVLSFKHPSGPEWKANIGDGTNRRDLNVGGSIANGQWHHLAATFDRDGQMVIYEDGVLKGSVSMTSIGNIDNGAPIRIGNDINGNYNYNGKIQEVRLWKKSIDQATLDAWKCTPLTPAHPYIDSLVGYWRLDEGSGNIANDGSVLANDGVITGQLWTTNDTTISYANTPRITDVAVTALDWLCIDTLTSWGIDGASLIKYKNKVTELNDGQPGSLRSVVASSCPNDSIFFAPTTDFGTQGLFQGAITIPHRLSLIGNGMSNTLLSGQLQGNLFVLPQGIQATFEKMTLSNGNRITQGGAIFNQGNLFIKDIRFQNNFENGVYKSFTNHGTITVSNIVEVKQ